MNCIEQIILLGSFLSYLLHVWYIFKAYLMKFLNVFHKKNIFKINAIPFIVLLSFMFLCIVLCCDWRLSLELRTMDNSLSSFVLYFNFLFDKMVCFE